MTGLGLARSVGHKHLTFQLNPKDAVKEDENNTYSF